MSDPLLPIPHGSRRPRRLQAVALALVALAGGCTVGPDFQPPREPMPAAWAGVEPPPPREMAIPTPPVAGEASITEWWKQFGDRTLTSLVEEAVASNLSLAQAQLRIREARAQQAIVAGGLYPTLDVSASADRARGPGGTYGNSFRAGFDASWELDIFGGTRRGVEAADAGVESAVFGRDAVLVSLAGEVATAYLDLRGSQQQLTIAQQNLESQQQTLDLTKERLEAGFVSALDVANAEAQVAATMSRVPSLEASINSSIYALSVLLGRAPAALLPELSTAGPLPTVPGEIPVGLPSELLRRRPDIRQAEADWHAATARIGVATADLFPRFSITGSLGLQGDKASSLGTIANRYWSIGPAVSWNVFDAGRTRANIELQRALADESAIAYKAAVLNALGEVETALISFSREQRRCESLIRSADANRRAVDLALQLYSAGRTDFLNVLTAQRSLFVAEDAVAGSQAAVVTDLIAVYKALGGGWNAVVTPAPGSTPPAASP